MLSPASSDLQLVQRFWALYQSRQWAAAQALLHQDAVCKWWATAERFDGAAAVVHVNAVYPEGWTIHLLELNALNDEAQASVGARQRGRVHSLVRVDQDGQSFYANSFFSLERDLIIAIDEYWSDAQPAPAWRRDGNLPGRSSIATDQRSGLSLALDSD